MGEHVFDRAGCTARPRYNYCVREWTGLNYAFKLQLQERQENVQSCPQLHMGRRNLARMTTL